MADAAADHPDASGQVLTLGKVDQVRVRVAYGRMLDGPPHDVFLLDWGMTAQEASAAPNIVARGPVVSVETAISQPPSDP